MARGKHVAKKSNKRHWPALVLIAVILIEYVFIKRATLVV